LVERKYRSIVLLIKQFIEKPNAGKEGVLNQEWSELGDRLYKSFIIYHPDTLKGVDDLKQLIKILEEVYQLSLSTPEPGSSITISYALNSTIYCSGDVTVIGAGCYNTKIHTGGTLRVKGSVRGGEIYAAMGVEISEVGSEGCVPTQIKVPQDQFIKIEKAMEGTLIQIGKRKHKFHKETKQVFARLDENEHILLV
jgi:hypothetical protein